MKNKPNPIHLSRRGTVAVVLMGLGLALFKAQSAPPSTGKPAIATGTYSAQFTDTLIREADGNVFFAEVGQGTYEGDLSGPFSDINMLIIHADGSFNAYGIEAGEGCTIGGRTGNFTARWELTGTSEPFHISGHLTFTGGTGGLAGLRGEGDFSEDVYSYNYHFDP
jgi:hypothetical protein